MTGLGVCSWLYVSVKCYLWCAGVDDRNLFKEWGVEEGFRFWAWRCMGANW